jgi:hypothetical protein
MLAAFVAVMVLLSLKGSGRTRAGLAPSPPTVRPPSPSPVASAGPSDAHVTGSFADQGWVEGERLSLSVNALPRTSTSDDCSVHTYVSAGTPLAAFDSGCRSWKERGRDILFFRVALRNPTLGSEAFALRNFVLSARDGRTYRPVNVSREAQSPQDFLPAKGTLPADAERTGYVTFDGHDGRLIPAALSYEDGRQTLEVLFVGQHDIK